MRGWPVFGIGSLLIIAGSAMALDASISIDSASAFRVEGLASLTLPTGSGRILASEITSTADIREFTGTLTVWTWTGIQPEPPVTGRIQDSQPVPQTWQLRGQPVALVLDHEALVARIVADQGSLTVDGWSAGDSSPRVLERPVSQSGPGVPSPWTGPESVEWDWDAGWVFIGDYESTTHLVGRPPVQAPVLNASGEHIRIQLSTGNLSFLDKDGTQVHARLGEWSEPSVAPLGIARQERAARAILNGSISSSVIPLGDSWGFAAPELSLRIEGESVWRNATGTVVVDGRQVWLQDETLRVKGRLHVDPAVSGVAIAPDTRYLATGEVETVEVSGRPVAAPPSAVPTEVGLAALAAAVLAYFGGLGVLLGRASLLFYTRLSSTELISHPRRARILEVVRGSPGIHLRALHRATGGAWGPFTFHIGLLRQAGQVHLQARGRHVLVTTPGAGVPVDHGVISETALRVLAAIAPGQAISIATLRADTGLTRQLLDYHLKKLAAHGHVILYMGPDGRMATRPAVRGTEQMADPGS